MPILLDYERACQQTTDKTQREQIALEALNFLLQNTAPDQESEDEIALALEQEANAAPGEATPLPEGDLQLNDVLCAHLEAQLADFFPSIFRLQTFPDPAAALNLLARARMICQKVDTWRQYTYWTPLFDFLRNATPGQWRQWRSAVIAQQKARAAIGESKFSRAKRFALYGLQRLAGIADHRLYLDLCSRLENAIAEGDAYYCVALALGYWVVKESLVAGHYLRAAGMRHNLGNQLLLTGKNAEAIAVLEQAQQLCNDYGSVRDMPYYQINGLERLACAYLNRGEEQRGAEALARYEFYSRQPREHALHRLEKGCLAMRAGTHETAEQRFEEARQFAQGEDSTPKEFYHVWNAYLSLGWVCTLRRKPDAALANVQQALIHGEALEDFLNADRWCHYYLVLAEARMAKNELAAAQTALDSAEARLQDLDSPRRNMQCLLTKATLREAQGNASEAQTCRDQAIQIALANGFSTATIALLKMAVFN
ncbi:MAG: hypothetical protein ALAOOOJD_02556 [bacterium]|nr:hypothetical protein [bacterium]